MNSMCEILSEQWTDIIEWMSDVFEDRIEKGI